MSDLLPVVAPEDMTPEQKALHDKEGKFADAILAVLDEHKMADFSIAVVLGHIFSEAWEEPYFNTFLDHLRAFAKDNYARKRMT